MPDELFPQDRGIPVGEALRALPLESPAQSAWPALAARLPKKRSLPRWPMAIAASLALGLAFTLVPHNPSPTTTVADAGTKTVGSKPMDERLLSLMAESAQLESLVNAASDDVASSATTAAISLALQDQLQDIDGQLQSESTADQQLDLWQQRVALLRDVASLESSRHYLAAEGRGMDLAMVSTY
ncbi:hypothetical protein [Arenimonas sp.]|uniref:hypothetical protein n=1 Tax=Arenimonas sp. TaxID=1872635 RepID=UPI0039E64185